RFVSFVVGWDLFMVDLRTGRPYALTSGSTEGLRSATPDTMGDVLTGGGHWWSPDGSQIAYIQTDERAVPTFWYADLLSSRGWNVPERYPQPGDPTPVMALKVVRNGAVTWIDTRPWAGWYMARVAWLPDSRHLALQMLSRDHKQLSLVLADSATGATRTLLTDSDPCWVNVVDDLRFFSNSCYFLWSSERDSYRHLYLYGVDGKQYAQLTSGPQACVGVAGVDEVKRAVYYIAWPDPYTEAHLKRVTYQPGSAGFRPIESVRVTPTGGSHFPHLSPDCSLFGDLRSNATRPAHLALCRSDGEHVAMVEDNPCAELQTLGLREFSFLSLPTAKLGLPSDAMAQYAKLLEPANRVPGKRYPVIVYVYGGPLPGGFGLARNALDYWRPVPELWLQMMSQQGFGVFTLDNRGSNAAPRGHDWETPIHHRLGEVELADQLEGVAYLKSLDWVDGDRLGLVGGSFGGFMTLNAMLKAPGTFAAAVAYAPVTDWREYDCVYAERYMGSPKENALGYRDTAIAPRAHQLQGELLLVHGASDPNVHLQHSMRLIDQLVMSDKRFGMVLYPTQVHMSFFGA
ncbi:MAG: alpha/beta fold hydrolase, partial [Pseudomonadota bacterium]